MSFRKLSIILRSISIVMLIWSCFTVNAFAMKEAETVRVGYALMDGFQEGAEGEYKTGYGYEYLQHIANRTGWHYEYVYGETDELYNKLVDGEIDLMGYLHYTAERDEEIIFSNLPQGKESFFIYTLKSEFSNKQHFQEMIDHLNIGVLKDTPDRKFLEKWLKNNEASCNIIEYADEDRMYEELEQGRLEGVVASDYVSRDEYKPLIHIGYGDFFIGVSDESALIAKELNEVLKDMYIDDRYLNATLYSKYYSNKEENTEFSDREKLWLENNNYSIRLGYLKNNLPYSGQSKSGELMGVISTLATAFKEDFGVDIIPVAYDSHEELIEAAGKREIDLYGPLYEDFYASEIDGILNTSPIVTTTLMLLHKDPECFKHELTLAYEKSNAIQYRIMNILYPDGNYKEYGNKEKCLRAIDRGDADCLILSAATINIYKQYSIFDKLYVTEFDKKVDICLGVNEGRSELLSIVNRVIRSEKDKLMGAALIENSYINKVPTFEDFIRANAFKLTAFFITIIIALIAFFVYYWKTTSTIVQMKNRNESLLIQAFRDELTKTGNRAAYLAEAGSIDSDIVNGLRPSFKVIVADINGLKAINDHYGHDMGDKLIINASNALCRLFAHSPVYRIGGDEFVIIPKGEDMDKTEVYLSELECLNALELTKELTEAGAFSISFGVAVYDEKRDRVFKDVFEKADAEMYRYKSEFKKRFRVIYEV